MLKKIQMLKIKGRENVVREQLKCRNTLACHRCFNIYSHNMTPMNSVGPMTMSKLKRTLHRHFPIHQSE